MQNKDKLHDQLINFSFYLAVWNAVDRTGHWGFQHAAVTFLCLGLIQNTGQQSYTAKEWHSKRICPLLVFPCRTSDILPMILLPWLIEQHFSWSKALSRAKAAVKALHFCISMVKQPQITLCNYWSDSQIWKYSSGFINPTLSQMFLQELLEIY